MATLLVDERLVLHGRGVFFSWGRQTIHHRFRRTCLPPAEDGYVSSTLRRRVIHGSWFCTHQSYFFFALSTVLVPSHLLFSARPCLNCTSISVPTHVLFSADTSGETQHHLPPSTPFSSTTATQLLADGYRTEWCSRQQRLWSSRLS